MSDPEHSQALLGRLVPSNMIFKMAGDSFSRIEISSLEGRAQSTRLRQKLFHSLHTTLGSSEKTIKDAILADSGYSKSEVNLEYALAISDLRKHYASVDLEQDLKAQKAVENLKATTNVGIVYIVPAKQNLFYCVISALTAALAAGNCVVVELPPTLTQVSGVLRKILPSALDADIFGVSGTRPTKDFLSKCHVLEQSDDGTDNAQSEPQARVVAIVDRTADILEAAMVIGASRVSFNGRSVYAPDVVLVNEFVADNFLYHLVQTVTSPLSSKSAPASQNQSKYLPDGHARTLKELENNDGVRVVVSSSSGSIMEVKDRTMVPLSRRIEGRLIIVVRITSLDDAIDLANSFGTPLEANYSFATPTEANYLARFIDARISCINHIPAELLVGPLAPKHPAEAPSPSPRYSQALFRTPRPRLRHASELTTLTQAAVRSRSTEGLESWSRAIVEPALPAMKQGDGHAVGFFDQAFLALGVSVVSLLAGTAFYAFKMLRRR
ncbi:aldehyde dehydrogenase PutA [Exophiala viscosa]|uniref:aldehyde dehydrogenase PutA n=1 Tax=Exophiala viscosa TaxID=2486360 RepID=UPI00218DFCE1|nr:aldehyde dehydrogenase PutA [Exophiala viscosa]